MLLEGEAGIGKTRLVDAFLDEVAEEDAWLLYGSYPPMGIRGALSDALLARFGPGDLEGALRPYFASVPSLLRPLVDAVQSHTPSSGGSLLEGDALHSAFVHLLRALAAERPVLWVVEDLHFAPVEIRALVTALARAVEGHRILLVLTTRSEIPPAELALLASLPHLRHVGLDRLAVRDVVLMLEDALGSVALAERVGIRIAQCTDGVPLFVLETVRNLKTTGALSERPDGTCFVARTWGSLRIPRAVQDLLEERLEQVRGDERTILEMGAVAGHEFDPVLVARALGHPRLEVLQTLAGLERRTGIVRSDEHVFRFDHHQIHELVRSRLSEERQARHHSRLAEALASHLAGEPTGEECHALARHHLLGRTPEEARPYLLPALDHLSRTCGNEFAVDLAERALGASGVLEGAQRVEVLLRLVERLDLLGVRDRQAAAVREAGELAAREGEPLLEARALVAKGRLHLVADEYEEARVACRRALACARRGNGRVERMQAASTLARTLSRQGALAREKRLYEAIGALARVEKDESAEASATINIGTVWMELGHYEEARRCFERGRELAEHGGHLVWCANAMANLQEVRLMQGDLEGAPARSDAYLQLARNLGDRHGEAQGLLQLGRVHATQGDLDAAEDCYERSLALFREIGGRMGRADCLWMLGCLGRRRGEFETARLHLQGSLALAREIRNPLTECKAAGELGRVLVDEGRLESAIALLDRQLELSLEMGIPEGEAMAAGSLADVFLMLGRVEDAQGFARRVQEIAEHFDHPAMHAAAEDLRGRIAWRLERLDEAEACFTRRLELAQALAEPPLLADAHLALGTLAARRGKVDVAQVELSEAVSLASGAGYAVADVLAKAERACLSEGCREPALAALSDAWRRASPRGAAGGVLPLLAGHP